MTSSLRAKRSNPVPDVPSWIASSQHSIGVLPLRATNNSGTPMAVTRTLVDFISPFFKGCVLRNLEPLERL